MALGTAQASVETPEDFGASPEGIARRYIAEIDLYESKTKEWTTRSKRIIDRYRDERSDVVRNIPRFNILWSTLQTTLPIYYAKLPKSDVQRRFKDEDIVARVACDIAERALDYSIECDDRFDRTMRQLTEDFALVGRGLSWQRYVPHFRGVDQRVDLKSSWSEEIAEEGVQLSNETDDEDFFTDKDGNKYGVEEAQQDDAGNYFINKPAEVLDYEETLDDYVNFEDFGHNIGARTWEEVYLVWRVCYLTRSELHERFDSCLGEGVVSELPLDFQPKEVGRFDENVKSLFKKARIYEIWDKAACKVIWVSKGYTDGPLDVRDDPLGLTEFFPCPKPVFATTTNNTLIPIPDFAMYQDQAAEIDNLTARIALIEKAIKVRGLYPGNIDAIRELLTTADDNDMIALDQGAIASILGQAGGDLSKIVYFWPVDILVKCLETLIKLREQLIQDIYQITGFGDILRGVAQDRETATTSQLKSQWGSLRVTDRQKEIQRYARDALRLKFEVIFNHYDDQSIWMIADCANMPDIKNDPTKGMVNPITLQVNQYGQIFPAALKLLRDSALRHFRVDIETDSTVAPNDAIDKQNYNQFLQVIGAFFAQAAPVVEKAPMFAPFVGELLMKGVRLYKTASSLESTLETAVKAFQQQGGAPQQGNGEAAAKMAGAQATAQVKTLDIASRERIAMGDQQLEAQAQDLERGRLALEGLIAQNEALRPVHVQ